MANSHSTDCPAYCPAPDLEWRHAGAALPKCRGGDCTLCDEVPCTCEDK